MTLVHSFTHSFLEHRFCGQYHIQFSSVQSLSRVRLFATPWTAALQASLFITNSQSLPKLMSTESVMPSNHLILCHPLLLLPSIFSSIRVFSNESALRIRWPKYWSSSFSISPSIEYSGLISWIPGWGTKIPHTASMSRRDLRLKKISSLRGKSQQQQKNTHT